MTIIYPLGKGSMWGDNELRYSLRSLQPLLSKEDQVIVVGEKPEWLLTSENTMNNLTHLPMEDLYINKERNIMLKISHATVLTAKFSDIIVLNDDYIFRPVKYKDIRDYVTKVKHKGLLQETVNKQLGSIYGNHAKATIDYLANKQRMTFNYDIHWPVRYVAATFLNVMSEVNWNTNRGYLIKSLYFNMIRVPGTLMEDVKVGSIYADTPEQILKLLPDTEMFSLSDSALGLPMKQALQLMYPKKSKFEA